jgi:succinyl-CoA synthetase alpha subunit
MTGFNPKVHSALQEKMADKPSSPFRIVVEVIPGHIGETIQRLSVFGVVVEASHDNLIQALATSEQISLISADASVVRIRLPLTPEELNPAR